MNSPYTTFITSSISVHHNAIKSLIFTAAELCFVYAIYKAFSLIAAKANLFTPYLMFTEDLIQQGIFLYSKGFSKNSALVLLFTGLSLGAKLYGTLIWAADNPGYILKGANVTALSLSNSLLPDPAYIVSIATEQYNITKLSRDLPRIIGANLFEPGVNVTLTSNVHRGIPEVAPPTQSNVGGRIWLDSDGLSVSPDTGVMVSFITDQYGHMISSNCTPKVVNEHSQFWNCTFRNAFAQPIFLGAIGRPEVHWDDATDKLLDTRYINPDRMKNIWASFGQGAGTVAVKQMFTITKGIKRHTFIETTFRGTMVTKANVPFSSLEVADFLGRTWSRSLGQQKTLFESRIHSSIINAQTQKQSFLFGVNDATNLTTWQAHWEFLSPEVNGEIGASTLSILRISMTNITLIRSETISRAPVPFENCDESFQNVAYGGKVTDTDCTTAWAGSPPHFMGQVDTSAFLIIYGLGDGRSNISSEALNDTTYNWMIDDSDSIDNLLISRGFIVGIDPSLVMLEVHTLRPAISYLQIALSVLAVLLAVLGWGCVKTLASAHWSSTLLSNLLAITQTPDYNKMMNPGYIRPIPDIQLSMDDSKVEILVENIPFKLEHSL